jgi:hypothetical protein
MVQVERDDLLRALKGFKGIAKQDLLIQDVTPQSDYRKTHAEARREIYTKLINLVEEAGITEACVFALSEYNKIPESAKGDNNPVINGHLQALELFFNIIGITSDKFKALRESSKNISKFFELIPQVHGNVYAQN